MPDRREIQLKIIGKRLRELRKQKGFKGYKSFAQIHDLDPRQYLRLENGESDFQISSLLNILDIYGMTIQEFFDGIELPKPKMK